ncbi:unnamed protein product [Triticum turgidum subsp. durum]|uniref:Protein kinase domain-containing protein n=1 Tax=Triticum turgidum subsp. durum TaxID=4567 RepID=A0A9R0SPC1_TRITD|nr:unnamed protein product [Triticum turgidum subsp. durum]
MKKKYFSWEECINLREVKSLRRMNHPNIVKLKEVIRENDMLFFVFEYMECNLYQLMKSKGKPFSETEIRNWCFQVFQALSHMHQRGYFHRDLKPENLLVTKELIKVADFGLAREIISEPPYTEYVSTRCIVPQRFYFKLLFTAQQLTCGLWVPLLQSFFRTDLFSQAQADEIYKICSILGTPNQHTWAGGLQLAASIHFQFPQSGSINLSEVVPTASEDALNLISWLCSWDPRKRPTAVEVLQHPFFQPCFYVPPSLRFRSTGYATTPPSVGAKGAMDQKNARRYPVGTLSNGRPAVNNSYLSTNAPARAAGVQRKLELDHQVKPMGDHKLTKENAMNQPWSRLPPAPVRSNGNYLAPKEHIPRGGGAPDIAEKLSQLSMASTTNRAPTVPSGRFADLKGTSRAHQPEPVRRPVPLGPRDTWHARNDPFRRTYEMPGERALLQRKLVS